jgi:molybdenum cofactor synthesis domain-containing protein
MTAALALTIPTRTARGSYQDDTGSILVEWLTERGFDATLRVAPDGPAVEAALRDAVAARLGLVVSTGGTGIDPSDRTPEYTRAVLDIELQGFGEELRRRGSMHTPYALLSRAVAGVAGRTLIVNLPGSPGAVRDALELLDEFYRHALEQLAGGDHLR